MKFYRNSLKQNMRNPSQKSKGKLAVDGGKPVRSKMLPYGRQSIDNKDVAAVTRALRSDWLTTGPLVAKFETQFAKRVTAPFAVCFSSGTAALHGAMHALGLKPNSEVIVPALTFAASANAAVYLGARPVFCDVDPDTLLLDPADVAKKVTDRTAAVVAVDLGGQPCDYDALRKAAPGCPIVSDACHSLGASFGKRAVGTLGDLTAFSFHPVKHITTGEGGMVTTANPAWANRLRHFRNHGITTDFRDRIREGTFSYDMQELGFNYRLTELQCALGISQLRKLNGFLKKRRATAKLYDKAFEKFAPADPIVTISGREHAHHLYLIRLNLTSWTVSRDRILTALRAEGIGANLHYAPVYWHSFYAERGYPRGLCPVSEREYPSLISLPLHQAMKPRDVADVMQALQKIHDFYGK